MGEPVSRLLASIVHGPVAQLVERRHGMAKVVGSIPIGSTPAFCIPKPFMQVTFMIFFPLAGDFVGRVSLIAGIEPNRRSRAVASIK